MVNRENNFCEYFSLSFAHLVLQRRDHRKFTPGRLAHVIVNAWSFSPVAWSFRYTSKHASNPLVTICECGTEELLLFDKWNFDAFYELSDSSRIKQLPQMQVIVRAFRVKLRVMCFQCVLHFEVRNRSNRASTVKQLTRLPSVSKRI